MTPALPPEIIDQIRRACRDASETARGAGKALARAQDLVGWEDWDEWLAATCGLSAEDAQLLMDRAEDSDLDAIELPAAIPAPVIQPTVICGWCERLRADQGLPPKHVSGPAQSLRVARGSCAECEESVDRVLARYRRAPPPDDLLIPIDEPDDAALREPQGRPAPLPHEEGWALARARLRQALFHMDQVTDAARALKQLAKIPGLSGLEDYVLEVGEVTERLTALTAEFVLLSQGEDYDDAAFGSEEGS